jgi:hypothetical protein
VHFCRPFFNHEHDPEILYFLSKRDTISLLKNILLEGFFIMVLRNIVFILSTIFLHSSIYAMEPEDEGNTSTCTVLSRWMQRQYGIQSIIKRSEDGKEVYILNHIQGGTVVVTHMQNGLVTCVQQVQGTSITLENPEIYLTLVQQFTRSEYEHDTLGDDDVEKR